MTPPRGPPPRSAFRGLLLGGAVGDALGAPVEFLDLAEIRRRHGPSGVRGLVEDGGRAGAITDDTQMTLFTAEALLRGGGDARRVRAEARRAYLRWLHTQGEAVPADVLDGWLVAVPGLHARRAPGGTCLSALRAGGHGTRERPANDSKGCGGVMRVAPVGLVMGDGAFDCACDLAAITHGHPTGQLASGYLAELVRRLRPWLERLELREVITRMADALWERLGHEREAGSHG